jgi:hypothetical protein
LHLHDVGETRCGAEAVTAFAIEWFFRDAVKMFVFREMEYLST